MILIRLPHCAKGEYIKILEFGSPPSGEIGGQLLFESGSFNKFIISRLHSFITNTKLINGWNKLKIN